MAGIETPVCNNRALREAGRRLNQFYDQFLAPSGLRATQFSLLASLKRLGPIGIQALASELGLDRTTLGRNILPLERDGLILVEPDAEDRRGKRLRLSAAGLERLARARPLWAKAQQGFEAAFGAERAAQLRELLAEVSRLDPG
ncbi:MarR family winged helix-turn-helix transcriptional regulator [Roseateles violae]|uniref:MarR family winged helix-turn-helix transcriptional regulator n=1 Tax=Roseateles violae TaxID=3058042 RepID=A0ABT8DSH5_9BURK|nr:MarR family winged helix-turn-helix transcriptional regulator [Pelomonas sp. PFR6]MDN3921275.1 MarR family winged helix-turn-helix transcriptional regulator [Pelomonas sp. PFR6]